MRESAGEVDPYRLALDALKTAGLIPYPIMGYRAEETDSGQHIGVLEYEGTVGAEEQDRIGQVMGDLAYLLDEVIIEPDGTWRRAQDGRPLGRALYASDRRRLRRGQFLRRFLLPRRRDRGRR